jgi:Gas vesicle synthesis protein GvpL/GvpF
VDQRRRAADELARWAAEHAPELVSRAEAEAVLVLRDALVAAATEAAPEARPAAATPQAAASVVAPRGAPPAGAPQATPDSSTPTPPATSAESSAAEPGELLWAYCVMRADDPHPPDLEGVDEHGPVQREQADGLVALVSRVPRSQFGADPLRRNLNDLSWLERVARRHEAVLDATLQNATLVPLRMCTVYENGESVRAMLRRERVALTEALAAVEGRLEWAVKVLVDQRALREAALKEAGAGELDPDPEHEGEGSSYLRRRRLERETRTAAGSLASELAERVHARLQDWAIDGITRPPQNRELSGHSGEMVLNAAYLVDRERTDELRELVAELEEHHRLLGVRIELTGPWPPYNFVPGPSEATLT